VQQRTKRKRAAKALRSAGRAEDILKQETAYEARKAGAPQGHARDVPSRTRKLDHPMDVAAQHWMQALMLPWAGWTALGAMMMNWPIAQMRLSALQRSDEKKQAEATRARH
jgi:hypothetical protein